MKVKVLRVIVGIGNGVDVAANVAAAAAAAGHSLSVAGDDGA